MSKTYFIYILTNQYNTVFYVGITNNLQRRGSEHRSFTKPGFSSRYRLSKLVYFEKYSDVYTALKREKRLKQYPRQWKINLIVKDNPEFQDLFSLLF